MKCNRSDIRERCSVGMEMKEARGVRRREVNGWCEISEWQRSVEFIESACLKEGVRCLFFSIEFI